MRLWSRLDRAIAREVRGPLWLGLAGFTMIMVLNFLFKLARQMIERHIPAELLLGFVLSNLPRILVFTIPMAVLLGVLVGIGRMATQSELIALRSSGISPARLFRPAAVMALFMTLLSLLCSEVLMPLGWRHERNLVRQVLRVQDVNREITPGVFYDRLPGSVLFAKSAAESAQGRLFTGILLYREAPDGQTVDLLVAKRGRGTFNGETGQHALLLDQGEWHMFRPAEPDAYNVVRFDQYTLPFPPDAAFQAFAEDLPEPAGMNPGALWAYYATARDERSRAVEPGDRLVLDARIRKAGLEWHQRLALPMTALGLACVAFPLAARSRRGGRFAGLSQSLMIILVFWLALSLGRALSESGKWPVWLGPWVPVVISGAWAAVLWSRMRHAESRPSGVLWTWLADLVARLRPERRRAATGRAPGGAGLAEGETGIGSPSPSRLWCRFAPGRLDLFLGSGFLKMFGAVLFVLLVLALAVAFRGAIDAVDPQARTFPWAAVLRYLALSTPAQLRFMVPMAALFGAAIALAALARTGEITALKAAGIGPARMAATLLTITGAIALVYAAAQETMLPAAARESQRALDQVRGKAQGPELLETGRRWLVGDDGRVWTYLDWDARRQRLIAPGIIRVDLENARVLERVQAGQARRVDGGWVLENGWRRTFDGDGTSRWSRLQQDRVGWTETADLFGEARSRLMLGDDLAEQLTLAKLWRNYRQSARTGYPAAPMLVGINEKIVFPLLPVALVLLGVPLSVSGWHRKGSLYGFGVALLVVFAFWILHAMTTSLGREGVLNPVLASWLPLALVVVYGGYALARAR